jgi:hypothetical protein
VREEDFVITQGEKLLSKFRKTEETQVTRAFCSSCGSRIQNILHNKPWFGFFPATLDEDTQHNLPEPFKPTMHYCGHESVIDTKLLDPNIIVKGDKPLPV